MKFLFLLINVLIFSNYLYASNLFETSFNNIEFNSINIQDSKKTEINKIKFGSFKKILRKILNKENFNEIEDNLSEDFINTFIKNIIINDEKIINNQYAAKIKINFDKKRLVNYLREKKIPYVEYHPDKFLLIFFEHNELNQNLFSKNNTYYSYYLKNLKNNHLFQIPNLDINDRFILKKEDLKNKDLNKIINFGKKYYNNEIIIVNTNTNNQLINYDLLIYSDGVVVEHKFYLNEYNLENFFYTLEDVSIDIWKGINQIQNNTLNIISCKIDYFNILELKEIRKNLKNNSIIQKLDIKSLALKSVEYDIYYYGNEKIFFNILQQNKLQINKLENFCTISLK